MQPVNNTLLDAPLKPKEIPVANLLGDTISVPKVSNPPQKSQTQLEKDLLINFSNPGITPYGYPMPPYALNQAYPPVMGYPAYTYPVYKPPTLFETVPAAKTGVFDFVQEDASKSSFNFIKDEINKQNKTTS